MKIEELRDMSDEQLGATLHETKETLFRLQSGGIGPVVPFPSGVHLVCVLKRDFAGQLPLSDETQKAIRRKLEKRLAAVLAAGAKHFGLVEEHNGSWRIKDKPPAVRHLSQHELHTRKAFASYAETLQEDRRVLLQRYHLHDVALKIVRVGSVGTFCAIGLFISDGGAPLLLQIKEAQQSVLAFFAGASEYTNHGQRVVVGKTYGLSEARQAPS